MTRPASATIRFHHVLSALLLILSIFVAPAPGDCGGTQKKFIIGGWIGPYQTEEQYLLYKKAGFNTVLDYPWEMDKYQKTLELAKKAGLDVILNIDQQFLRYKPEPFVPYERIAKFIKEVRENKVVIGYNLYDEPNAGNVALLVEAGKFVRSQDPDKLTWISFFLHNDKLARAILKQFVPTVISSPEYPYRAGDDYFEELYRVLETYRAIALENGVPLWLFVQSSSWPWPEHQPDERRAPAPDEIRMQVYSNLAYGAKALWYFTYASPRQAKEFTSVIMDREGRAKPGYAAVRALNAEVQALAPVLMSLKSVDVMHVKPAQKNVRPFSPNNIIADIKGENVLLGFFKDKAGTDYFMLVNKLTRQANTIRLRPGKQAPRLYRIDKASGKPVRLNLNSGIATINLKPGDGMLVKIN